MRIPFVIAVIACASCSGGVPDPVAAAATDDASLATDDGLDVASDDARTDTTTRVDDSGVDASARDSAHAEFETTTTIDSAIADSGFDSGDSGPCVKHCLTETGLPLGTFCGKADDCCSGYCKGPGPGTSQCAPPIDPTGWKECP